MQQIPTGPPSMMSMNAMNMNSMSMNAMNMSPSLQGLYAPPRGAPLNNYDAFSGLGNVGSPNGFGQFPQGANPQQRMNKRGSM
jgi:hypothetical protein